jgi:hypothetical protein
VARADSCNLHDASRVAIQLDHMEVADGATDFERVGSSSMWVFWGITAFVIWVAIAFWPARVAARKGHSFIGYFLLSLLFFPLALIMAYMVQDRSGVVYP